MRIVACLTALALSISSAAADPQDYGRVVTFGDSLSDNGNLTKFSARVCANITVISSGDFPTVPHGPNCSRVPSIQLTIQMAKAPSSNSGHHSSPIHP